MDSSPPTPSPPTPFAPSEHTLVDLLDNTITAITALRMPYDQMRVAHGSNRFLVHDIERVPEGHAFLVIKYGETPQKCGDSSYCFTMWLSPLITIRVDGTNCFYHIKEHHPAMSAMMLWAEEEGADIGSLRWVPFEVRERTPNMITVCVKGKVMRIAI